MSDAVLHEDEFSEPSPSEWVYFSVVGNPRAGYTYEEFPEHLTPSSLHESLPTQDTRAEIVQTLTRLKFEVDDGHGATVTARGSVALFREVFDIELVHRRRTTRTPSGEWTSEAVVPKNAGTRISTLRLPGALFVAVAEPPTPLAPRLPPPMRGNGVDLRSPGDIAQLTRASAVHRLRLPSGEPATGLGIVVGMLDFGFAPHPFYDDHGYRITRLSAPCANDPEVDPIGHGTGILATLLACAPDAHVLAIKMGPNNVAAIAMAAQHANTKVLSLSFSTDDHRSGRPLSDHEIAVWIEILNAVSRGIVVVSAGGNFGRESLPALLTDVIAVGGLEIDQVDRLTRWPESSYFVNPINPGRRVPDVCAMASTMTLPAPEQAWVIRVGATSAAAPQVAGVAALLLQRCPGLTPDAVRAAIVAGARAVDDTGTGAGLVSALGAWRYLDAHPPD